MKQQATDLEKFSVACLPRNSTAQRTRKGLLQISKTKLLRRKRYEPVSKSHQAQIISKRDYRHKTTPSSLREEPFHLIYRKKHIK